jgi:hypothetical protein
VAPLKGTIGPSDLDGPLIVIAKYHVEDRFFLKSSHPNNIAAIGSTNKANNAVLFKMIPIPIYKVVRCVSSGSSRAKSRPISLRPGVEELGIKKKNVGGIK